MARWARPWRWCGSAQIALMRADKGIVCDVTQPNSPAPARRGLARLAAAALVVVGLVGSIAAAGAWRSSVEERAQQSMEVTVGAASAAVASNVARSVDLLEQLRALVVATPDITNTEFARYWDEAAIERSEVPTSELQS